MTSLNRATNFNATGHYHHFSNVYQMNGWQMEGENNQSVL